MKNDRKKRIHRWLWCTKEGDILLYKEMDSRHLFNSIRMIFNNITSEELRIPGGNTSEDIKAWSKSLCHDIIRDMITELELRQKSRMSEFFSEISEEERKSISAIKVYNELNLI